jgi:hypothetical protein
MKLLLFIPLLILMSCSSSYKNMNPLNKKFPSVSGNALDGKLWNIPENMKGNTSLFLIGYKQDSQFDIDRWLIGLDMKKINVPTYELPTIKGLFPRMFSTKIDEGMRRGIPKSLWKGVITIYKDGDKVQEFTGNEKPNNARVIYIDDKGIIQYFHDEGFSVQALKKLISTIKKISN